MRNKEKVLKEFDHNDLEALCEELSNLIEETKEWVEMLDNIASEGKKKALITHPKLMKRMTHKLIYQHSK